MEQHLASACAVVTGAASGIGRATAIALADAGAVVIATDIDARGCAKTVTEIESGGGTAVAVAGDLSTSAAMRLIAEEAQRTEITYDKALQVVVHAAGICQVAVITEMDEKAWRREIDANLTSTFLIYHELLPRLVARKSGVVVTLSSSGAKAQPMQFPAYVASKSAVIGLHGSVAKQFADSGVSFFTVCPGYVDTPMGRFAFEVQTGRQPSPDDLAHFVAPDEVAGVIRALTRLDMRPASGTVVDIPSR